MNQQGGNGKNGGVKLKTGVLTFHKCINYGSYWQARCLVEWLKDNGCEAVILDHNSPRINLAELKCAFRPVLPTRVPKTDYPLYRKKIEKFFQVFDDLPLSQRFPLENPSEMEDFDLVVVGSDEVWNLSHPWYGGCAMFFGKDVRAKRLISYAASFGNYHASAGLEEIWADKLRNFDAVSVRDENSRLILKETLGCDLNIVLDPCLLRPPQPETRRIPEINQPYIAVYGHNFSEDFIRKIKGYAASREFALFSIGYRNDWADRQWLTADPFDFADFIASAEAVATNFFHGCVFSLINSKPFACESTAYRNIKVQDLMKTIGGEKHLISSEDLTNSVETILSEPLKPQIQQKIEFLRRASEEFLFSALK